MANVSKKTLTLAKLEALMQIQDVISPEKLAATIKEGLDKGEITTLTPATFEGKTAELKAFAEKFGLVKEAVKGQAFGGVHRKGYFQYIKEQYPDTIPLFDTLDKLCKTTYDIKLDDGSVKTVQPMPFCRDLTPKPEETDAKATPTEQTVTV
jgi:hypothetical protein